jgi:hypothetical protein
MQFKKNPEMKAALYRHITESLSKPRVGWHLSDFVACNWKTYYRKTGQAPESTPDQNMIYWMGHAAQFFLAPVRPEEAKSITVDGILMTPDFSNTEFGGYPVVLAEMKTSRKSQKNFHPKDTKHYLMQIMGYCKGLGLTKAELIMYFIHGDYTQRPPTPTLDVWTCEFTKQEIDDNWSHITRCRDVLIDALEQEHPPSELIMLGDWECNYCECRDFCPNAKEGRGK